MALIKQFVFNPFMENTYVVYDDTKSAVVIDPGCYEQYEKEELTAFITENELEVTHLLNTHCHIDHILGNEYVASHYNVPLYIHKDEEPILRSAAAYAPAYGFRHYQDIDDVKYFQEGDSIDFGNTKLNVVHVPGHSPGHVAFVNETNRYIIGGDVLFNGSIGRTDLPGGNFDQLISSIRSKIFTTGEDMIVYSGHGPETTVGEEKRTNPFCGVSA